MPTSPIGNSMPSPDDAGFTLIELLTVLAIVALLVGVTPVLYRASVPSARLNAATSDLITDLKHLCAQATQQGKNLEFTITEEGRGYALGNDEVTHDLPGDITLRYDSLLEQGESRILRFYPTGTSTGGTLTLSDGIRDSFIGVHFLTSRIGRQEERES